MNATDKTAQPVTTGKDRQIVNLKFLDDFMKRMGLTNNSLSKALNISRQAVGYWFSHDDATLSKLEDVFDTLGYKLTFNLVPNHPIDLDNKANVQMRLALENDALIYGPRLDFLNKVIKAYKLNKAELTKKMNVSATTIYYWQSHDDCLISNLYKFAECADFHLDIRIDPKGEVEQVTEFNDDITLQETESQQEVVIEERYEELQRNLTMIGYMYEGFIRDVDKILEGDSSISPRVRRSCLQIVDLLKEFRTLSVEAEK